MSSQYRELPVHDYLIPPINLGPGPIDGPLNGPLNGPINGPYPPPPHPTSGPYLHPSNPTNGPYPPSPQSIGAQPIFLPHNGGQHHGPHGHEGHGAGGHGGGQGPKPGVGKGPVYYEDVPKKEV